MSNMLIIVKINKKAREEGPDFVYTEIKKNIKFGQSFDFAQK